MTFQKPSRQWPLWLTLLLNSAACLALVRLVYRYQTHPFDCDEANHALPSLMMARAMRDGEWLELARLFYDQSFYPPAMAVLKAVAFALFKPSFLLARLFSVACLFLAILVLYALCISIDPQSGRIGGLVAAALTLTAQPLLVNAGLSMVELPGLLVSLLLLWAYVGVVKRATAGRLLAAGFLLAAVFLTKYTYGIATLVAVGLTEITLLPMRRKIDLGQELRSRLTRRWPYLFGPFVLIMGLWFLSPAKISGFVSYTQPLPGNDAWLNITNIGHYLRSLAIHYLPSRLFIAATAAGLVWAAVHWRHQPLRPILLYFVVGMGMIILINHPDNPRFISTFVPAANILTGLMVARLIGQVRERRWHAPALILLVLVGALAAVSVPNVNRRWARMDELMAVMVETDPVVNELAAWIQQQVPPGQTVVMVNYLDQLAPNLFAWYQGLRHPADLGRPVGAVILTPPTAESLAATRQEILDGRPDYLVLFEGGPWGHPFWPEYAASLEDGLTPLGERKFTITAIEEIQDWLDDNSITAEAEWIEVNRDSRNPVTLKVMVYDIHYPDE
jgi:hypothetical protein